MIPNLLFYVLLVVGLFGYSQNDNSESVELVDVIIWEAEAKSGGKFIGVSPDEFEAQTAIDELTFIKEGTKYNIMSHEINVMPVLINKNISVKDDFISEDDYLEFKYISEIELIALEYMEANDIQTAISFYTNVCREKNPAIVTKHLKKLQANYSKYLFEYEPAATLVTYSE